MRALALGLLLAALSTTVVAQDTLNKCIDAEGKITYTNQPCKNAREVRKVAIDPPPEPGRAAPEVKKPPATQPTPAKIEVETQRVSGKGNGKAAGRSTSSQQCDSLAERLGRVIDKMDRARRQGYSQDQMNEWNAEVRELERKKQDAGCF